MSKRRKKQITKLLLFIILSIVVIFLFLNFKDKEPTETPSENIPQETPEIKEPEEIIEPEPLTYLNEITYTNELPKEVEEVIVEYMDLYYKSIKQLKEYDMTYLFKDPTSDQALINQAAVSLLIEIRSLKPTDLKLKSAKYDLDIKKVTQNGDTYTITVAEGNYLNFNFMKEIESRVYNIENTFTIVKTEDGYKISKFNKVQDFFVMITDRYKSGGKEKLDAIKKDYLDLTKKNVANEKKDYEDFLKGEGINRRTCDHGYDREAALEYAKSWVNKRNSEWSRFDANCQNYASQVVYAGGIAMDHTGSAAKYLQWKFYDASYNESEVTKGYVYTWTSVTRFYAYARDNKGQGLCATVDTNLYYAEAGDIIQVGTSGPNRHTLVSIGPYKKDGKVVDILVNSNTVDLENYPMSAYAYPYTTMIKIYGYND